jgi:hypothetical protein
MCLFIRSIHADLIFLDMVVFHNTFIALRSQDEGHPLRQILDHELQDEDEIFGG